MSAIPPAPSDPSPIGPIADDASIHLLAELVLESLVSEAMPPSIVRFRRCGSAIEMGMLPLDGAHPSGFLVGHRPDDDCFALGLAAQGWAYHLAERAWPDRSGSRVHLATIVSRSGERAHLTRVDDPAHPLNHIDDAPPSGEQVDLLRRAFDLPTEPAPCPTGTYWSIEWLAGVSDLHAERGVEAPPLGWPAVVAAHPAASLLRTGGEDPEDHDFIEMVASFARVCDWSRVRALVDSGGYRSAGLLSGDGAWFDDGSIARYLLGRCPPLATLRADVRAVVTPDADRRITEVLDALDVPDAVWPDIDASAA